MTINRNIYLITCILLFCLGSQAEARGWGHGPSPKQAKKDATRVVRDTVVIAATAGGAYVGGRVGAPVAGAVIGNKVGLAANSYAAGDRGNVVLAPVSQAGASIIQSAVDDPSEEDDDSDWE
jgi:hypothetical protein